MNHQLPSYDALFNVDFKEGEAARSVYSPAAYLADLLQLIDDHVDTSDLDIRRTDLKEILLDAEHTFSEIPYLDLVNELLENKILGSPYETLKDEAKYPFNLPFNLHDERIKLYLDRFGVNAQELYQLFTTQGDATTQARLALGLSPEMVDVIIADREPTEAELRAFYHNQAITDLSDVSLFLKTTGITGTELRELLFQQLSPQEQENRAQLSRQSFIHAGLGGFVALDLTAESEKLVWQGTGEAIPTAWFSRVNRLLRLAQATEISLSDLDLILRSCCHNMLNETALPYIAVIKKLADTYDLAIDVVCGFFSDINIDGHGHDEQPLDLFNQVFNEPLIAIDRQYLSPVADADYLPQQYQNDPALKRLNFLAVEQELFTSQPEALAVRNRLLKSLHISTADLQNLINQLDAKLGQEFLHNLAPLSKLSLYYRICRLAETLDLSISELFVLCDLLEQDSTIRQVTQFDWLIHFTTQEFNCYRILATGSVPTAMWLVQTLCALTDWMRKHQFAATELQAILATNTSSALAASATEAKTVSGLDNLYQQFKPVLLQQEHLVAEAIAPRTARIAYKTLVEDDWELVSAQDQRLLDAPAKDAQPAIYEALQRLAMITPLDFIELDIQEKLQEKIFANLILHGYSRTDGTLIAEAMPQTAADLQISHTFDSGAIFDHLHELYQAQSKSADSVDPAEEFAIFLGDLAGVKLCDDDAYQHHDTAQKREELYDNLIYNGYLSAEGEVSEPLFFADIANRGRFEANVQLVDYQTSIFEVLEAKAQAFLAAEFKLEATLFADLPLTAGEVADLIENLQFNDYIDEHQVVIDKEQLLKLEVADLAIALAYYPHRHQILAAIQQALSQFKAEFYTVSAADFSQLSRQIIADEIYTYLDEHYLENHHLTDAGFSFFADEENAAALQLGHYFDENANRIVFKALHEIVQTLQTYRVTAEDFEAIGLVAADGLALLDLLVDEAYCEADGSLTPEQVAYFLNINNALDIALAGFEDFAKDIFFVVHGLAKQVDATVQVLSDRYRALVTQQEATLLTGLQELFEIPAETVKAICGYVFGPGENLSEQFILPLLQGPDEGDRITQIPDNYRFMVAFNRIRQFALLANKLGLDAVETDIVFRDQNLADKFSEKLELPTGVDHIEGLVWLNVDDAVADAATAEPMQVILLHTTVDEEPQYWLYRADNYQLLTETAISLSEIADELAEVSRLDASFNDAAGNAWLVAGTDFFYQPKHRLTWEHQHRELGKVDSNFEALTQIDAAFVDRDRKLYLFAGDQYLRSSDGLPQVDEGYPKTLAGNWSQEHGFALPAGYSEAIDAALIGTDDQVYFFQGQQFISSADFQQEQAINAVWGRVKNQFTQATKLDAALALSDRVYFFAGDQLISWSYSIETADGYADEGSIQPLSRLMPELPDEFRDGVDAAFLGVDDRVHLFKNGHHLSGRWQLQADGTATLTDVRVAATPLNERWGQVRNTIQQSEQPVSAAFSGLDGHTYLFCGDQYVRYSGNSYTYVDEGYPRRIADHWGGLNAVDAAFILDGKTYLVGRNAENEPVYVRYSTNDYTEADRDYPQPVADNWWVEHFNLQASEPTRDRQFASPDAVLVAQDGVTYLFKGTDYIAYDRLRRWWSEPRPIADKWAGLPEDFVGVEAAFTGKDGRTYLFLKARPTRTNRTSRNAPNYQYLRYTDKHFNRVDDRYPKAVREFWGRVKNQIADTNRIDAAVVLAWAERSATGEETGPLQRSTYLFSGDQFYRYTTAADEGSEPYAYVDEGYPKAIATGLAAEPRFQNLPLPLAGSIDAVFGDRRNVHLFMGDRCLVVSEQAQRHYAERLPAAPRAVLQTAGALYVEDETAGWQTVKNLEGGGAIAPVDLPPLLRELPAEFSHDLDAVLLGTDQSLYVFKGDQCYNDTLAEAYPIAEEWWQERNNIVLNNRVDAAFVGVDGKLYLFSGDQYLTYTPTAAGQWPQVADGHPQPIREAWGGLETVHVAFVRDGKTYLLEALEADGTFRYVCYSGETYTKPDGAPQIGDIRWWNFPSIYLEEGFDRVDAVLVEDEQMFLFKGNEFIHYNREEDLWTYPRPVERIWRDWPFAEAGAIATVCRDANGVTYFFSADQVTHEQGRGFSAPIPIRQRWGRTHNPIQQPQPSADATSLPLIDAAVVINDAVTYLFSGGHYVRYSTPDYRYVDAGYPKAIVGNLRQEAGFAHLPERFDEHIAASLESTGRSGLRGMVASGRHLYIFVEADCYVVSQQLTGEVPIHQLGRLQNHLAATGRVDAAFVRPDDTGRLDAPQTFLFSGDQYVRYTGADYDVVDDGYPKAIARFLEAEGWGEADADFRAAVAQGIDAACWQPQGELWLFQGAQVWPIGRDRALTPVALATVLPTGANPFADGADTAFTSPAGHTYFFKDGQYICYRHWPQDYVDEGYPKSIRDHWGNLPAAFETAIDHAFVFEGRTYFIKQMADAIADVPLSYEYVRYSDPTYQRIDPIYPQPFTYRWGDWHDYLLSDVYTIAEFKALLDRSVSPSAAVKDLLNVELGAQAAPYQLLGDATGWDVDTVKWLQRRGGFALPAADVEVNFTIELLLKMRDCFAIADRFGVLPRQLYELVYQPAFESPTDLAAVADTLYQWLGLKHSTQDWELLSRELHDEENLLKQSALLPYVIAHYFETDLKLLTLPDRQALATQTGRNLVLVAQVGSEYHVVSFDAEGNRVFGETESRFEPEAIAPGLQAQLAALFAASAADQPVPIDGPTKQGMLRSLATLSPDIVPLRSLENARDLFAQLLIDVNMGSEAKTSKVKEAISAIQLYLHRYFVNLEAVGLKETSDRDDLKRWWTWMRNYRVWEANRKVFLYPENYIRPELRDTKSPIFKQLEEALMQGEVTNDLVTGAFYTYLEEFAKVGNLKITGANVHDDGEDQVLVLFGHTRTEPVQYYYQTSRFLASGRVIWGNWLPVDITINSTRVFPVYAFGRVLLFWIEIHTQEESVPYGRNRGSSKSSSATKIDTSDKVLKYRASIKYSFYGFNHQWVQPQTLQAGIELEYHVDAAYVADRDSLVLFSGEYCLTTTPRNPQGDIKRIAEVYNFPASFDESFYNQIDAAFTWEDDWLILFKKHKCAIGKVPADGDRQAINWQVHSISEIFKDAGQQQRSNLAWHEQILWQNFDSHQPDNYTRGVAAAFNASAQGNTICLIDHDGAPVFFQLSSPVNGDKLVFEEAVVDVEDDQFWKAFFAILTRNFLRLEPVDAVFQQDNLIYMLRQGQYECYRYDATGIVPLQKLDGFPKPIKDNLGFNLDQFFNRLHVVEASDQGRDFVSLTYINPKANAPLLNGQVSDDFEFIPTEFVSSKTRQVWQALRTSLQTVSQEGEIVALAPLFSEMEESLQGEAAGEFFSKVSDLAKLETRRQRLSNILTIIDHIHLHTVNGEASVMMPRNTQAIQEELKAASEDADNADLPYHELTVSSRQELRDLRQAFDRLAQSPTKANLDNIKSVRRSTGKTILQEAQEAIDGNSEHPRLFLAPRAYNAALSRLKADYRELLDSDPGKLDQRWQKVREEHEHNVWFLRSRFEHLFGRDRFKLDSSIVKDPEVRNSLLVRLEESKEAPQAQLAAVEQLRLPQLQLNPALLDEATTAQAMMTALETVQQSAGPDLTTIDAAVQEAAEAIDTVYRDVSELLDQLLELYFGKDDVFPAGFGIDNQFNFTFGQPDWHIFEAKKGTFLCRPLPSDSAAEQRYEILRLTTTRIPQLSQQLFAGGVDRLLSLDLQLGDEMPLFKPQSRVDSDENLDYTITYAESFELPVGNETVTVSLGDRVPNSATLDFHGANNNYYWEIFFHAPYLIAQTLNGAQKFEDAKRWYEFIFDPTADVGAMQDGVADAHWRFLPFARIPDPLKPHLEDHLRRRLDIEDLAAEIAVYLNDPFDPHAIARIRETAYQKAIVMAYIDNLMDWGDMLFRQYTQESINEARMLYVLAYDLLGERPVALAQEQLPPATNYAALHNPDDTATDLLLDAEPATELAVVRDTPHATVESPYFYIPDNSLFLDYWNRVEDRLYKIRHSLNIDGVKQALPLFQPPIDPMALVQAVAGGANLSTLMAGASVPVPHYRFNFMLAKAKELVQRLHQFGGDLLSAIEKRDSEQLNLMQQKQEATILSMLTKIKEAQIGEAQESIRSLEASLAMVEANETYNRDTVEAGLLDGEITQLALMSGSTASYLVSIIASQIASVGGATPDTLVGPFIAGLKYGGGQVHASASAVAEASQTAAEALSLGGEVAGIIAQHQRLMADLQHQVDTAIHDKRQIQAQIEGAKLQLKVAEYELAIHEKEIEHNRSIATFMTDKFSNEQLYQWMTSQLSGLYYQAYKLAYDMAKAAEKAFQYERGLPASEVNFISGMYWNSQRKGLLAGDSLGLDLDRMEQAFIQGDRRRFEISKPISLLELDPLAFLTLKATGKCEFELSEALFDYDFPGHYCRQIKTLDISFDAAEGQVVNATLTQLNHKTVLTADPKAVKYLLDPKGDQPLSVRSDWRANEQIVLSHVDQYEKGHGLFERRLEDDRYLPFEGTGAVSRWRLELNGKRGSVDLDQLLDATITIQYTALPGGERFADAVKGLLKPYDTVRFIDLNFDFHTEWLEFLSNEETSLTLTFTPALFPNLASSRITGLFSKFELQYDEPVSLMLNNDDSMVLQDGQFLETPGLSVRPYGTDWTFTVQGDKSALKTVQLVVGYKASV